MPLVCATLLFLLATPAVSHAQNVSLQDEIRAALLSGEAASQLSVEDIETLSALLSTEAQRESMTPQEVLESSVAFAPQDPQEVPLQDGSEPRNGVPVFIAVMGLGVLAWFLRRGGTDEGHMQAA